MRPTNQERDMTLDTRPLGTSGLEITRVGFGAWAISGTGWSYGWGPQDDADSIAAIHAAVEAGVNWIDTAAAYGAGHSEEVVGRALRALPQVDRPYVFTKCGLVWDGDDPHQAVRKVMKPASVRREIEASLRRLGVDARRRHGRDTGRRRRHAARGVLAAHGRLKAEGKLRAIGLSNHDVAQLEVAEGIAHVDALQPPFSAIHRL